MTRRFPLVALAAVLVLSALAAASATAAPTPRSIARLVEQRTAARFVSQARPHVAANCRRRGSHRFKCRFAIRSGEDAFAGRVRVRVLHSGRVRMLWGELHLGGFGPGACVAHPGFTISQTDVPGIGALPGTSVPPQACGP